MTSFLSDWQQQPLAPTGVIVGPCAWRITMLAGPDAAYVAAHPSLIVVNADDSDQTLAAASERLAHLPVLLNLREPAFARRLPELIRHKLAALGRTRVDILALWVEDVADLKGGNMLQVLRQLRDEKIIGHLGLGHTDIRNVEWLAKHTPARVLVMPFDLADQAARYRAIDAAREYGMARIAAGSPIDADGVRFALGARELVLPVLERPIAEGLVPMGPEELEERWRDYAAGNPEPAPLPRGQPPE